MDKVGIEETDPDFNRRHPFSYAVIKRRLAERRRQCEDLARVAEASDIQMSIGNAGRWPSRLLYGLCDTDLDDGPNIKGDEGCQEQRGKSNLEYKSCTPLGEDSDGA